MLPKGYTISSEDNVHQPGTKKYRAVRPDGKTLVTDGWFLDEKDVPASAWADYYGQIAEKRNEGRPNEIEHVLAWRLPDGRVYTADHLDFEVPLQDLEEITISTHSAGYEIANMLCAHCGTGAVDDEILDEYHLLNEGWGYDDEDDEIGGVYSSHE